MIIASLLLEGYEDRVNQVADQVFATYHNSPVTREQLRMSIQARMHDIPLGSLKPQEFVKDVLKNLSTRMNLKKQPSDVTKQLDDLADRMASHTQILIANQLPDVRIHDLPDLVYRKFKNAMDQIFWDMAVSRKQDIGEWFDITMWPKVERAYKKLMGSSIRDSLADMYDDQMHSLAHDAAHAGKQVEPYLQSHGYDLNNPYR